jgi:hypothetical protein
MNADKQVILPDELVNLLEEEWKPKARRSSSPSGLSF